MAKLKAIFRRLFHAPARPMLGRDAPKHAQALAIALLVHDDTPEHERGEW